MSGIRPGERIGVLGLARSGVAAARLALSRGAAVYASDVANDDATRAAAERLAELGAEVEVGRHDIGILAGCERVVVSPGIPPTAPVFSAPELRDTRFIPELELAFEELRGLVIAVTGTNGKTTVTALAAHALREAGMNAAAGGNIGTALSELALQDPQPEVTVVEASSFQLGLVHTFAPDVGVLTNLAPDHLDRYATLADYYADKAKLFQNATPSSRWVLNAEDRATLELAGDAPGERYLFRVASEPEEGERGGYLSADGWLVLRIGDGEERLLPASELGILGPHNVANALAAALAARLVGASAEGLRPGLRSFVPMKHRLEPVLEKHGVLWVNDSKSTNISSTEVGLKSLGRPTVLLLGGRHKGEPYDQLIPDLREHARAVVAYGEAVDEIAASLEGEVPLEVAGSDFEQVLRRAAEIAQPGDAVLLSPACSSFDMFRNYEERGAEFRRIVTEVLP